MLRFIRRSSPTVAATQSHCSGDSSSAHCCNRARSRTVRPRTANPSRAAARVGSRWRPSTIPPGWRSTTPIRPCSSCKSKTGLNPRTVMYQFRLTQASVTGMRTWVKADDFGLGYPECCRSRRPEEYSRVHPGRRGAGEERTVRLAGRVQQTVTVDLMLVGTERPVWRRPGILPATVRPPQFGPVSVSVKIPPSEERDSCGRGTPDFL